MAVVKYFTLPVYLPNVFSIDLFRDGINELKSTQIYSNLLIGPVTHLV